MTPKEVLKKYWGYDDFRPLQEDIVRSVLDGHDTLALLPTGGGKSVCFQVPAMMMEGVCLVVSPLISLMKDQVRILADKDISAACLVSGMNGHEKDLVLNHCIYGDTKFLYVSPERLKSQTFIAQFRGMKVCMVVVDEAHCISQWGYDFRPPYLEIAAIRQYHPKAPIMALTATATPKVVEDIQQKLLFRDGRVFRKGFGRDNVDFMVFEEEDKIGRLLRIVKKIPGSGIVYVRNRKKTQDIAAQLSQMGVSAVAYHAGLSTQDRDMRQQMWMAGKSRIVVATNAFGMGIDKPDVRFVVHWDIPDSPEAYFQEAGRAGRDGKKSYAVLLYTHSDMEHLDFMFEQDYPPIQYIRNVYRAICNFYQIPVGSGADLQFDFDLNQVCTTYGFKPYPFFSAVKFLEKEGLLTIPTRGETESRLYVPISSQELYRFQVENRRFGDLLQVILRLYGGLFTEFVYISEKDIARRCYVEERVVVKMLEKMSAMQVVSYKKKSDKPQIIFTSPRIDVAGLYLGESNYAMLKENARNRIEAMKEYVETDDECRSQMLLRYFGEESGVCGRCDVCRSKKKEMPKDVEKQVMEVLAERPMTVKEMAERLSGVGEEEIVAAVRSMLDAQKISMGQDFRMSCKSSL